MLKIIVQTVLLSISIFGVLVECQDEDTSVDIKIVIWNVLMGDVSPFCVFLCLCMYSFKNQFNNKKKDTLHYI